MPKIKISDCNQWKIELVGNVGHPYPVLFYNEEPVNFLLNRNVPVEVQEQFWKVLQEYRKLLGR